MQQTILANISGSVQGVHFRQSTCEQANSLGITGLVRNLPDGSVQIVATGSPEELDALLSWCHKGPRRARVDSVRVDYIDVKKFPNFRIDR